MPVSGIGGYSPFSLGRSGRMGSSRRSPEAFKELLMNMRKRIAPIRVSHVLAAHGVENGDGPEVQAEKWANAKTKIEKMQKYLKAGVSFAQLAHDHSDCPSGDKGGALENYFDPKGKFGSGAGRYVQPFVDGGFSIDREGGISDPIKTQFGYHLIRLDDRLSLPLLLRRSWMLFPRFRERFLEALNARG